MHQHTLGEQCAQSDTVKHSLRVFADVLAEQQLTLTLNLDTPITPAADYI